MAEFLLWEDLVREIVTTIIEEHTPSDEEEDEYAESVTIEGWIVLLNINIKIILLLKDFF